MAKIILTKATYDNLSEWSYIEGALARAVCTACQYLGQAT